MQSRSQAISPAKLAICIIWNLCSSIAIVFSNKWIYTNYKFPNVTLTCIHFFMTYLGLKVCIFLKIFAPKKIPLQEMILLCLSFCGFVVFTNLSLQNNTVGTYQVAKVMTTPAILFIHSVFYGRKYSRKIMLTIVSELYLYINKLKQFDIKLFDKQFFNCSCDKLLKFIMNWNVN